MAICRGMTLKRYWWLVAIGFNVVEGSGSSVTFEKHGRRAYFHRPHPQHEALIYRVKVAREFLIKLEITP